MGRRPSLPYPLRSLKFCGCLRQEVMRHAFPGRWESARKHCAIIFTTSTGSCVRITVLKQLRMPCNVDSSDCYQRFGKPDSGLAITDPIMQAVLAASSTGA